MSTKKSHIPKQTCSFQLQVCLSMCDLLVDIRHQRFKELYRFGVVFWYVGYLIISLVYLANNLEVFPGTEISKAALLMGS